MVFVKGQRIGSTPIAGHSLPAGTYAVRVVQSGVGAASLDITVGDGHPTTYHWNRAQGWDLK